MAEQELEFDNMSDAELDEAARKQGWRPESEWDDARAEKDGRRKPAKFWTAREYLERTSESLPLVNSQLRKTTQKLTAVEHLLAEEQKARTEERKKVDEMYSILSDQKRISKDALERARENGRKEAEAKMQAAVVEGDTKMHEEGKRELDRLNKEELEEAKEAVKKETAAAAPSKEDEALAKLNPVTRDWIQENPWFRRDPALNATMMTHHRDVMRDFPNMDERDQYEEAKERTANELPERFAKFQKTERSNGNGADHDEDRETRRAAPGAVNRTGWQPGGAREDTPEARFKKIPAKDQAAYKRQADMISKNTGGKAKFTIAEFMSEYE